MRYYRHRFLVLALGFILPIAVSLAFLQEPAVSRLLLNFTLKMVRFKTGIILDARDWTVKPFSFSIVFKDVALQEDIYLAKTKAFEFQFSPLYLLIGRIHLRNVQLIDPSIHVNARFFEKQAPENKKDFQTQINNVANTFGSINDLLLTKGLSFEDLTITGLTIASKDFETYANEIFFQKLGRTQFRLRTQIKHLRIPDKISPIENLSFSILLMKENEENSYMAIRDFKLNPLKEEDPNIQLSGRFPGHLNFTLALDVGKLNEFVKNSPALKSSDPNVFMNGTAHIRGNVTFGKQKIESTDIKVDFKNFKIDIFHPNNVQASVRSNFNQWTISNVKIELPRTSWETLSVPHQITAPLIKVSDNKIQGEISVDRVGLCGLLIASGVHECFVDLKTSGKIDLEGQIDNFNLTLLPKLTFEGLDVYADPKTLSAKESSHIVKAKPATFEGTVQIREKDLILESAVVRWSDKSVLTATGDIKYKPTVVSVRARGQALDLSKIVDNFIGIPLVGSASTDTIINYRYDVEDPRDKTKVTSTLTISDTKIFDQTLGELRGNVEFFRKRLRIGPLTIAQGGGLAHILGNLYHKQDLGTWLDLDCLFDQYEFGFKTPSNTFPVKGGWSGNASLRGILGDKSPQPFKGPIKLTGKNIESFGIPFEHVEANGEVGLVYLDIKNLIAKKSNGVLNLTGSFKDSGSWVKFNSDKVAVNNLGLFPAFEKVLSDGTFETKGEWNDSGNWNIQGSVTNVSIQPHNFKNGSFKVEGTEAGMNILVSLDESNKIKYSTFYSGKNIRANTVAASLDHKGIYSALAMTNGWQQPQPVKAAGKISFEWSEANGNFESKDFKIIGPKGSDAKQTILIDAPGSQRIAWSNGQTTSGKLQWGGDSNLSIQGNEQNYFNIDGKLSAPFLDLFIPDILILRSGKLNFNKAKLFIAPKLKNLNMNSQLTEAEVSVPAIGQPITKTSAQLIIENSLLKIQNGTGNLGSGNINFDGNYKIDFETEGLLLRSEFDRAQIVLIGEYPMTVSGSINIGGSSKPYTLNGAVTILDGLYSNEFSSFTPSVVAVNSEPELLFNVRATVNDGFLVKNSLINTRIKGTLFVLGNNISPKLQGALYLDGGSLFARDNTFQIDRGTLSFSEENNNVPLVSLQAQTNILYNTENYKIGLLASGQATDLKLDFNSEPSLSTQDTISLLTFGFIRSEYESAPTPAQDSGLMQSAGVEAFQAIFGKQIGANINKSTGFNVSLSTKADASDNEAAPKVEVMRRLGNKTTATFGRSLDLAKPENNLQVDYQLLKNLNLSGVWESETVQPTQEEEQSIGADLRFKFDLK